MTSMNHIVVDISSDEEDDKRVDYSGLFDVILEVSDLKPKSTDLLNLTVENVGDDDDDCVILDCDPLAKETVIDTFETDEVLVVGQKGEIACRDFPHPRHDCAKYPFKSTLHQQFCEMCHCYVCDSRAPCPYWFSGFLSSIDHCHANDKEQTWKDQREWIRTGNMLPRPVSKPASTKVQFKRVSRPRSVPSPQKSTTPVGTQVGIQAFSTTARVGTHPSTYTRPGYRTGQSRTIPQNPGSQTGAVQSLPNNRGGSSNNNPSLQPVPSNPYVWTRRPSRDVSRPEDGVQNIAQGSQPTSYALPVAPQSNAQRIVTGYINVPVSQSKEYAKHFNQNMYSGNHQTNEVPCMTPNPRANQQQQSGRSNSKVLSEFEDWLLEDSNMCCPSSGQDNTNTVAFDFETFFNN